MNISMRFDIDAGRYEDQGEKNYKYCDSADTIAEALAKWRSCEGYDFAEMELVVECDGVQSRIAIFGGPDDAMVLRMNIANLWVNATQQQFVDIASDSNVLLDEIESEISCLRKHNGALRRQNERAHKRVEELEQVEFDNRVAIKQLSASLDQCREEAKKLRPMPWQEIHTQFKAGLLTWTEAFDALMSQCGMPMEEALKCLAEHFDRRPVIRETEVAA